MPATHESPHVFPCSDDTCPGWLCAWCRPLGWTWERAEESADEIIAESTPSQPAPQTTSKSVVPPSVLEEKLFMRLLLQEPSLEEAGALLREGLFEGCSRIGRLGARMCRSVPYSPPTGERQRDLLPLPLASINQVRAPCRPGEDPGKCSWRPFTKYAACWLDLLVVALNHHYMDGSDAAERPHQFGPATIMQQAALQNLANEVELFLHQNHGSITATDWKVELSTKAVSYTGDEVFPSERLCWERLSAGMPPAGTCGSVDAATASEGFVRAALSDPLLVMRKEAEVEQRARTPQIWASDEEWEVIGGHLVRLGICSTIEESDIATFRGSPLLAGMMGVSKPGYAPGEGPQRLVMNLIPSNQVQIAIEGDMAALPTDGQWRCIVLRDGEVLFWSSDDLRCCFYIFSLPPVWHKYMAFARPLPRAKVGLPGPGKVHLCSRVVPMGWISATGVIQHIHRRLLRLPWSEIQALPAASELRRDLPLPGRVASGAPTRGSLQKPFIAQEADLYIGRSWVAGHRPSKWANPFKVTEEQPVRWCLQKFEQWMREQPGLMSSLDELSNRRLLCHCSESAPCHADVLHRLWREAHPSEEGVLWRAWQVYIDNLDVLEVLDWRDAGTLTVDQVPPFQQLARERYRLAGVPRSEEKAVIRDLRTKALGNAVDGLQGTLAPPAEFVRRLVHLTVTTLHRPRLTLKWMQILAGRWVRAMQFRRETSMAFSALWRSLVKWRGEQPLPRAVRDELVSALCLLPVMRTDLRVPCSGLVSASDASLAGGAVCHAISVTPEGRRCAKRAVAAHSSCTVDELVLIGLFDGIGGARRALDLLGIAVAVYASSETDAEARRVCRYAWPDVLELGDVTAIGKEAIQKLGRMAPHATTVLITAGSPCQDVSALNHNRVGLEGSRSKLFWEILRVKQLVQDVWPETQVWLLVENVASMDDASRDTISEAIGVPPVALDASCFCAARRPRYYWMQPAPKAPWQAAADQESGVMCLSPSVVQGPHTQWLEAGSMFEGEGLPTFVRCTPRRAPPSAPAGIHGCDESTLERWRQARWCYAPYQFKAKHMIETEQRTLRAPSADERERLLGFANRHTMTARRTSSRKQEPHALEVVRCSLLGNSFSCLAVAFLLSHWLEDRQWRDRPSSAQEVVEAAGLGMDLAPACAVRQHDLRGCLPDASVELVEQYARRATHRGSDIRLDTGVLLRPDAWPRQPIDPSSWEWRTIVTWKWRNDQHITALETRAVLSAVRRRLRSIQHLQTRFLHLVDNQGTLSVLVKCRSSSHQLNIVVRRIDALLIASLCRGLWGYVDTDRNPADAGSRL